MESKREISLKRFFFYFLLKTIAYVAAAFLLWVLIFLAAEPCGIIIPADTLERQVKSWEKEVAEKKQFTFQNFPEGAGYVLFDDYKTPLTKRLSKDEVKEAKRLYQSKETHRYTARGNFTYQQIEAGGQVCVVGYSMRATFRNRLIRSWFPNADILIIGLFVVLLIIAIGIAIWKTAKKMERYLEGLQQVAEEIQKQNLDFTVHPTRLKELNRVLQAFEQLKTSLSDSLQAQWKLEQDKKVQMSALAHDIKTPLTIIMGNSELLGESELAAEDLEYAQSICRNAKQMEQYVCQIIALTKEESLQGKKEKINTLEFFKEVVGDAEALAKLKKIQVKQDILEVPESFLGVRESWKRVFSNVIENAVRYTPEEQEISVTVKNSIYQELEYLECTIEDSGPGFSKEALAHGTEWFYQEDTSRTSRNNFGMGLAIASQITAVQGGSLEIMNGENGGAKVTVLIRIVQ